MGEDKRHFVLIHGACHGAWCWYKVASLVKSAGHQVTALDMAASGIHPTQVRELNSITQYFEPLMEFMASLASEERIILVGHSFGGVAISVAMENFPNKIAAAVFVTALMPAPDLSFVTLLHEIHVVSGGRDGVIVPIIGQTNPKHQLQIAGSEHRIQLLSPSSGCAIPEVFRLESDELDTQRIFDEGLNDHPNGSHLFGPRFLASNLYQLSPVEDLTLAMSLVRPARLYGDEERLREETKVTWDNYGTVAKVYVVCEQDKALKPDFQLSMVERNPTKDVKVIAEADHMPMFSKPQELFAHLQDIAKTYY
ncbi:hypothetical protein RIF29_37093 [Crotalaria pallida]|uniref:AB hydrolase-1 domain-containing protein n=1 Tax=Crotalaria pallida TaxID=3830 RepID=A0AAN9EC96_CROPI